MIKIIIIITINFFGKFSYNIKMLYRNRIDVSEDIDINKISASKECIICHYQYFIDNRLLS